MLDQNDVDTLSSLVNGLAAYDVNDLLSTGRGLTNWEDALYRTFYKADGTIAQDLPGTVVFFH